MPISARPTLRASRSRLIGAGIVGALVAALLAGGRITVDQIVAYLAIIASVIVAGAVTSLVARRQVPVAEVGLVPTVRSRVDVLGTIIVPALLLLGGIGLFGWLRPMPSLPAARGGRNALVIRSLVAPAVHLVAALLAAWAFRSTRGTSLDWFAQGCLTVGYVNLWLLVIAMVPVPPLPGSVLLERMLPVATWARYARIRPHLLQAALGVLLLSVMVGLGLTTAVQSLLGGWWASLAGL